MKPSFLPFSFSFLLLITLLADLKAQSAPKYSNEFLAIGVGARGLGMANTQAAVTNDVTAAYWNPAGLLLASEPYELSLMHIAYFGGIANYDYGGFTAKIDSTSRLAVSLIRFGIDDIPDTRFLIDADGNIDYSRVGSFAEASYAFMFSYAKAVTLKIKEKNTAKGTIPARYIPLRLGANAKIINRSAGVFSNAWGFGLDLGVQTDLGKWQLGIMGRDITGTYNAWNFNTEAVADVFAQTGNEIPTNSIEITLPRLQIGLARAFRTQTDQIGLLTTIGLETTFDGKRNTLLKTNLFSISPSAGVEIDYKRTVFLRGGIGNFQQITDFDRTYTTFQPNFGIGIWIKKFKIDYALTNAFQQADLPLSHVFSLSARFNQSDLQKLAKK
ncbi:hypothetical protein [Hugenholtzia roseola]|uniref:putative type IX sorting system protein PorV2 n=1 Tax=Hugenholtzia roseola TaxID=1002 RepID=UPI00047BD3FB|nr:hypothetical protein [Hugenholtzia roseola]